MFLLFLLFQESDYHWKYHGRVSPLLGIECPGLDGLVQSIHDKTLPRNLVKIEPKNLPPSYQWKMSALRNRLIFCSPRSLVKVYSRKIPLITCRNEMKTVHSTVHTVVLCLPVVIDNIQGKLSLRLSGVSRESVVSGVFGETLRLTGGRPADVWRNFSKIFLIRQLTWLAPVWRRRLPTHLLKTTLGVRICCESGGGEWSCPACRRCRDRRDTCRASPRCGSSGGWRDGPTCWTPADIAHI